MMIISRRFVRRGYNMDVGQSAERLADIMS